MKMIFRMPFIILIALGLIITMCSCGPSDLEIYMFSDLSECRAIGSEELEGVQVTLYDSPAKDKYIKDLLYADYYACNYSSADLQFDLFAYEFPDQATAQVYFKNATGKDTTQTATFSISQGLMTYRRIVISNNLAYSVRTQVSDADAVIEIINQIFSEKIIAVEW